MIVVSLHVKRNFKVKSAFSSGISTQISHIKAKNYKLFTGDMEAKVQQLTAQILL